jgi:pimeloyl-ACP methyl ester carboxylesterase
VLGLVAEGRSNKGIGERLGIAERAVQKHVTAIFTKLELAPGEDDNRRILAVLAYLQPGRPAALMIGLTLVTVVAVLGSGLKTTTTDQIRADYVVDGKGAHRRHLGIGLGVFPAALLTRACRTTASRSRCRSRRWRASLVAALPHTQRGGAGASGGCDPCRRHSIHRREALSMEEDGIARARAGDVELAYETFGAPSDPAVVLVMGLGTQMLHWPDDFCAALVGAGLFVVRFDNRDTGLSTHLHDAPAPDLGALMAGDPSSAAYTLSDMARDTAGLLDALGLHGAHLVGASMGGMIAQVMAIEHPDRVMTLTSIMSTTGDRRVGEPTQAAMGALLAPPARTREEALARAVAGYRIIGSPGFTPDEAGVMDRAGRAFDRAHDPQGVGRQLAAVIASPDRTERLRGLRVPALVVHGRDDPLVGVSGGEATAAAIPGAVLVVVDGMGHDLPRAAWPEIIGPIAALVARAEDERRAA